MTLGSFALQAPLRAALICAALYVGFIIVTDARAQQLTPAQATDPKPASSDSLFARFIRAFGDRNE